MKLKTKLVLFLLVAVAAAGALIAPAAAVIPPWLQSTDDSSGGVVSNDSSSNDSEWYTRDRSDIPYGTSAPYYMYFGTANFGETAYWSDNFFYDLGVDYQGWTCVVGAGFGYMGTTGISEVSVFNQVNFASSGDFRKFRNYGYLLTCWDESIDYLFSSGASWREMQSRLLISPVGYGFDDETGYPYVDYCLIDCNGDPIVIDQSIYNSICSNGGYRGVKWFSSNPICQFSYYDEFLHLQLTEEVLPYALGQFYFEFTPCDCGTTPDVGTASQIRKLRTNWRFVHYTGAGAASIYADFNAFYEALNLVPIFFEFAYTYLQFLLAFICLILIYRAIVAVLVRYGEKDVE